MVHDVKELGPKLNVEAIRDSFHLEVFEHREIEIDQAGADHAGASIVAEQIHARAGDCVAIAIESQHAHSGERSGCGWRSKATQLEVVDIPGIDRIFAARAGDATGIRPRVTAALAERIAGHHERHGGSGIRAQDST